MRLALQHQQLVAAPTPLAGQGTKHAPAVLIMLQFIRSQRCVKMKLNCWTQQAQHMLLTKAVLHVVPENASQPFVLEV